jgi:molybdopterin-binding protein
VKKRERHEVSAGAESVARRALCWIAGAVDRGRSLKEWDDAMKISARNQIKGIVVDVVKGATTSHIRIDIGNAIVTASITNEAVDDLKLAKGKAVIAVVKASDVLVGTDD